MASPWQDHIYGVDVSKYQPKVDWQFLKSKIGFAVCKACEVTENDSAANWADPFFSTHIQGAYDAGIPMGAFIYCNPYWPIWQQKSIDQYNNLARMDDIEYSKLREVLTNYKAYAFICFDVEKHKDYLTGAAIPSNWIVWELDALYKRVKAGMAAGELKKVPLMLYSSDSFAEQFCKVGNVNLLYDWVAQHPDVAIWTAKYPWTGVACTWEELRTKYMPDNVSQKPYYLNNPAPAVWQYGEFKLPNGKYPAQGFDVDLVLWSTDKFNAWLNVQVTPTPEPPTPEPPVGEVVDIAARKRLDNIEANWPKPL